MIRSQSFPMLIVGTCLVLLGFTMITYKQPGHLSRRPPPPSSAKVLAATGNSTSRVKRIFLATSFFGHRDWYFITHGYGKTGAKHIERSCPSKNKCIVSFDEADSSAADALLFHARDTSRRYKNRRPEQIYIMYGWESPWYQGDSFIHGGDFYNWTATYHHKANVRILSGLYFKRAQKDQNALRNLPQFSSNRKRGNATIAWVVSNCGSGSQRMKYMRELRKYMPVDIYGGCGTNKCPNEKHRSNSISCYSAIGSTGQYKFYLAFENSVCEDYVSLKAFRAANWSMVPIVLGGKGMTDYQGIMPPNSYLDVRNFTSPKKLTEYLKFLDVHDDAYRAYHAWRIDYWLRESGASHGLYEDGALMYDGKKNADIHWMCTICDALFDPVKTKKRTNIDWGRHWNIKNMCDPNLVGRKLKGSG